ncbi:MAG: beta-lactamase family protein, partial [Acidobacteria bacterium]|nr:beta-lactamase family protein [Acidobacteriota bacterium]
MARITALVEEAVARKELPGAVVAIGTENVVVWQASIGQRAVQPSPEPMTADTIFDAASLTKVIATTTSVMLLVEEGRLRLSDRVATHLPGFERYSKRDITIRHLLTHTSGLRPDLEFTPEWHGYALAISKALDEVPVARPDERVIYSDINFFLLGHLVGVISGEPLDVFAKRRIFDPLRMRDTMFRPPASLASRIAPTERCSIYGFPCGDPSGTWLRGTVHDPTARRMDNVAGHAGMFTTAADLARFCRMLLNGGQIEGVRILSPLTVARMTSP